MIDRAHLYIYRWSTRVYHAEEQNPGYYFQVILESGLVSRTGWTLQQEHSADLGFDRLSLTVGRQKG